jgi:FMN reductase
MEQMRTAVRQCYGWSMPYGVSVGGEQDFAGSAISNARLATRVEMMSRDLVVYGKLLRSQFASDVADTEPNTFAAHYRP